MLTALAAVGIVITIVGAVLLGIALIEFGSAHGAGKREGMRNYTYSNEFKRRSLAYAYDRGFKRGKKITHKRKNAKNWGEEYAKAHDARKAEAARIAKINGG